MPSFLAAPALVLAWAAAASTPPEQAPAKAAAPLSPQAAALSSWLQQTRDNAGAPYAVIDKRRAHLWLFDAQGRLKGSTAVLLGLAPGDQSVPGIGDRPLKDIQPHERTTPAGRFQAEAGHNLNGEDIYWVDYDAAVSMHRVRATNPKERRLQRLATATPRDNRISYGCINVPQAFYDRQIVPTFARGRPVVYVLPESLPLAVVFRSSPPPDRR